MSTNENQAPVTPGHHGAGPSTILQDQLRRDKFQDLDNEELKILASLAVNTLRDRGIMYSTVISPAPKPPDMFDNAKFEQIACAGLKPPYNGSSSDLIPTLNAIHFRRQNEVWCSATILQQDG
jgi:hypothetical protein